MLPKFYEISPKHDSHIDGSWRIDPYSTSITVMRTAKTFHKLFPYNHSGYGIYGSKEELKKVFRRFNPAGKKHISSSVQLRLFEYDKTLIRFLADYNDGGNIGIFGGTNFMECLLKVEEYFKAVDLNSKKAELYRPINKKYDVISVFIRSDELIDIRAIEIIERMMEDAERLRIQFLFLSESPQNIPLQIEDKLSWQLFLGKYSSFAEEEYDLETLFISPSRIQAGVVLDKENTPEYLVSVHELRADETEYFKEVKKARLEESDSYKDYLDSLISED